MNVAVLQGRLTKDPDIRYAQNENQTCIASYTLAVDRRFTKDDQKADFIRCKAFGKAGEFAEKYLKKGMKICVRGCIETGSYTSKEGQKVYTTDVIVDQHDFCESRRDGERTQETTQAAPQTDGFINIPDDIDGELPFV